jgi:hypothetical protein
MLNTRVQHELVSEIMGRLGAGRDDVGRCDVDVGRWLKTVIRKRFRTEVMRVKVRTTLSSPGGKGNDASVNVETW